MQILANQYIIILILFALGILGLIVLFTKLQKFKMLYSIELKKSNDSFTELEAQKLIVKEYESKLLVHEKKVVELETQQKNSDKSLLEMQEIKESFHQSLSDRFESLAAKVLEEKNAGQSQKNQQALAQILDPLKERIFEFQKKVDEVYQVESRERFALKSELERILELGSRMSVETTNLTRALKGDVKLQGNWGEIVLQRILESSGLREGEEFVTQGRDLKLKSDQGKRLMPDVVINLPDKKHLIIDSKVSLVHFEGIISSMSDPEVASNTPSSQSISSDPELLREQGLEQKSQHERLFIQSVNKHIDDLSAKKYEHNEQLLSPEFTLMFFPIEAAYSLALQLDPNLFQKSWEKSIVIVGPTTLLASLKTVASLWKQERQNKNAILIAAESGKLYDKFVGFLDDLTKVGESISKSQGTYIDAMDKLQNGKGNIITRFEKMKNLGAKAKKQIPEKNISHTDQSLSN